MNDFPARPSPLDLTVKFVGGPPIDDVVYWIRRCAQQQHVSGPLTVVLEPKTTANGKVYEVRLERPDRVLASERDRNLMVAVRNAFERLPASAVIEEMRARQAARRSSAH
jgi:hypothetical protein